MRSRSFLVVAVMVVAGMVFSAGLGAGRVKAQDGLTAAVVSGSCDSPGDVAAELRDLSEAEGGSLTSFTRIDIPIGDLTGGDYAVAVSSGGDVVACGDISGTGDDVYVPVASTGPGGYAGVAWLHARDEQTQVSLFIAQGLGAATTTGDDDDVTPPGDDDDTPPTDDDDATPPADDDTDQPTDGTTYTSPTFGYTVTYDETWEVLEEETTPTDNGPQDFLHLFNGTSHAYFYTNAADEDFPMDRLPDFFLSRLEGADGVTDVQVRVDDNGEEIRGSGQDDAWIAINFTWTNQDGETFELYDYYHGYRIPGQGAIVVFLNEGLQRAYDQQAPAREKLENGLNIPG
jgi:hypothetical protein